MQAITSDRPPLAPLVPPPAAQTTDFMQTFYRYRWLILGVAIGCALVGLVLSLVATPVYRATATLAVAQSKIGEPTVGGTASPAAGFIPFVRNHGTAVEIIKKHKLDAPPHQLTPATFLERTLSVADIRNTNLLVASVVLSDPQLAAAVVNDVANEAATLSHRLSQEEAVRSRDLIGRHLKELRDRLNTAEKELLTFQRTNQVELLRGEVDSLLEQRRDIPALILTLATERARLARVEAELARRDKLTSVKKSIDTDPALMEAAKSAGRQADGSVLGLSMTSESVNPVYEGLDAEVAAVRAEVAALEKQRAHLIEVNGLGGPQLAKLTQLYVKESELARLQTEYDLAQKSYVEAAAQYENATLQVAARSAELQVIDAGFAPDRPFSPRPLRDALMWLIIGLVGATAAIGLSVVVRGLKPSPLPQK